MPANLAELSDDALVELCLERGSEDDRPFAELFRRHHRAVWHTCRRYFRDSEDASELAQETFFRAYRALRGYAGGHPALFRAWLTRIASNTCKNELRRRSRRPVFADEPPDPAAAVSPESPTEDLVRREEETALRGALAKLAPRHREIIELVELAQMPYPQIAESLGISLSAVKMRALRARAALAAAYREIEAGGEQE